MNKENNQNNFSQNKDELELKPQPVNKIKEPENIIRSREKKENKINKIPESNISDEEIEHPIALISDYYEKEMDEIKKSFYENKKNQKIKDKNKSEFVLEELSLAENKKNLTIGNNQIQSQKFNKVEHDPIKLKENIGKVVLNSKFMKNKKIKKINSTKNFALIKPEKVVDNFTLESSGHINHKIINKINNNNSNKNIILKKNNSLNCIYNSHNSINNNKFFKKQKLIKPIIKTQIHQKNLQVAKIPLNIKFKGPKENYQINKISKTQPNLIINKGQKKINYNQNKISPTLNKIPIKKITLKNNSSINLNDQKNNQNQNRKLIHNYINKITYEIPHINKKININSSYNENKQQNSYNYSNIIEKENLFFNNNSNNLNINKMIINNINNNLSLENPKNIIKIISPEKIEQNIRKSNNRNVKINEKKLIEKIRLPLSFKVNNNNNDLIKNNNINNTQFYSISKEILNAPPNNYQTEVNNSIMNNDYIKNDNFNRQTIERGGKFNNISTTYIVCSKNRNSRYRIIPKIPKPLLTIENQNILYKNKILIPNSSTLSIKSQKTNNKYACPFHSPSTSKINPNEGKLLKMYKSQKNLLNGKCNYNISFQTLNENNYSRFNYSTNSIMNSNASNSGNKNNFFMKSSRINSPIDYNNYDNYDYDDNKIMKNDISFLFK